MLQYIADCMADIMYRALVVDDEKWVRKGIVKKLLTSSWAFESVAEAEGGEEGLAYAASHPLDLIITDIKMDTMDGIEMIRRILGQYPQLEVVIISGYAEFEYAEQAINMDVVGYLLKPIQDRNFEETLGKAIRRIEKRKSACNLERERESLAADSKTINLEKYLNRRLHSPASPLTPEEEKLPLFCEKNQYILLIFNLDSASYGRSFSYQDAQLSRFGAKNILCEMAEKGQVFVFDNFKNINQLFILFYGRDGETLRFACDRYSLTAYSNIVKSLEVQVTMGISRVSSFPDNELYRQAESAFGLRMAYGGNKIYYYDGIDQDTPLVIPENKLKLLERRIELLDFSLIKEILYDIFSPEYMRGDVALYLSFAYQEIINILIRLCGKLGIPLENKIDFHITSRENLHRFYSADQMVQYLYTTVLHLLAPARLQGNDGKRIVESVHSHLKENFSTDITVRSLASIYAINADYLSTLYRQETGKTIIKELTELRIREACRLLKDSSASIKAVAATVGYSDMPYFCKVFKKLKGITPTEFREGL